MAIVEARVKDGTLTLGTAPGLDISCQLTNIRINTAYADDGDAVEVLCGDTLAPGRKMESESLAGTFIQDWTGVEAEQISAYLWDNNLAEVDFTYTPNEAGPTFTGKVRLERPAELYGGDVNTRLTSDFEWFGVGADFVRTPPVAAFASMSLADLQAETERRGLSSSGTKAELTARLTEPELVNA